MNQAEAGIDIPQMTPIGRLADFARQCTRIRATVLRFRDWRNRRIDQWLGIDTIGDMQSGRIAANALGDSAPYEATDYPLLEKYIRPLQPGGDDTVYDIGCGLGRTLCMFARRNVRACIGIECSDALASVAMRNATSLRARRSAIEIRVIDAIHADYSDGNIFWLYNPFGAQTLQRVLNRIKHSLDHSPRPIKIAYVYPVHASVLDGCRWLRRFHIERSIFHRTSCAMYWTTDFASAKTVNGC